MALTQTRVPDPNDVWGRNRIAFLDIAIANNTTYPSGGFVINAASFGLKAFKGLHIVGGDVSQGTYLGVIDFGTAFEGKTPTTAALRLFTALGTELAAPVGSTGYNVRLVGIGV